MGLDDGLVLRVVLFLIFTGFGAASTFISDDVLHSNGLTGRSLLQTKTNCPLNFEFMNYTIITSKCKGPRYPADLCCGALTEFACPYAAELNDLTNNCASTMFSYLNIRARYPPGLFSSECKGGKDGLICPAAGPQSAENSNSGSCRKNQKLFALITIVSGFMSFFLVYFNGV
ncbi:GPI-anchored protein LLG1-like [Dioscorea cayenensis subsp. rotundata]|uniref:GPI-anchored protein LLG1-like n=1 Tax=Dioscorea cayennensis subsp. rotundata TaxID=55577 RepID=A0AB40ARA9_DIOCR|nr:GPI-anchored protein LLG1-like [Dioscorea cayenensis subsp. rotundata]